MPNASLRVLVPESTTNYVTNPTIRNDTTGWFAVGSTMTRTLDRARFGIASLKLVTNGTALNEGAYFRVSELSGIQDFVTVSIYVRGAGYVRIRLNEQLGGQWVSQPKMLTGTRWTRLEVTGRCTGKNDVRLYVETADNIPKAVTFYADGAMMELKPYATTYVDGDQPGCRWNVVAHSTISTRDPYTRQGGRWVALAGPCREDDDIYVTAVGGMGMPSISNNVQSFAQAPGSYFQNSKIKDRVITLTFNVKKKDTRITPNPSLNRLHELRQQLIDIFKPDKVRGDEEFVLEYTDGQYPIYIAVRYEAGLEGSWDIRNQWINTFPVRFLACSPMFWEDDQEVASLAFLDNFHSRYVTGGAAKINGNWNNLNYGLNNRITSYAFGKNGEVYAGGQFTVANYSTTLAIDPLIPALRIAVWNGTKWSALGLGADDTIEDVAVSPTGYVYVCGAFLNIGGVAANRIAYWNPNTSTWNAMGSGLNGSPSTLAIAPNGDVYCGGAFTTAGGITAYRLARWDGLSWHSCGALLGLDGTVLDIEISPDGSTVYICGNFTTEQGGVASVLLRVAKYDVATNIFSALGSGFGNTCHSLALSQLSGILYVAGEFTTSGSSTINRIAKWNGSVWVALGTGMNGIVYDIDIDENENIIASGKFTTAGGVSCYRLAYWNGSVWVNQDVYISKAGSPDPDYQAVKFHPNGDLYIGGQSFWYALSYSSAYNLITNAGSSEVSPSVYIKGPGTLRWLENQTTGKRMYMNLSILNNEEVTIDFGQAKIYSSIRGDLSYSVLPGSDFKSWKLAPGENKIAAFMIDDVGGIMQIRYTPQHHSTDATARESEMV